MPNKLKGYRNMFGINQKELASLLGIGLNTYSFKENDKTEFTKSELIKLTKFFKEFSPELTMDELFYN